MSDIPLVWNRVIDPESSVDAGAWDVVTLRDLNGGYLCSGLRKVSVAGGYIDMAAAREELDRWHDPALAPGESSPDGRRHNFGDALWLHIDFANAKNVHELVDEVHLRKLVIADVWGIIPGVKERREASSPEEQIVSRAVHEMLLKRLGRQFLGWDNGENDGRWFWQSLRISPSPTTRKEVKQAFRGWFERWLSEIHGYSNALCGLTFPHYLAEIPGHRMIGGEFLQGLPSVPMWSAWIRGAARQHQMLWMAGISLFDTFGYKTFEEDRIAGDLDEDQMKIGFGNPCVQTGPDRGHSISRLRRAWYLLFMYGVNFQTFELGQFVHERMLSAVGKLQLKATKFCEKNKEKRGVQYCPVALFVDEYSGWAPPRHLYTDSFYTVGGGIPYESGDYQLDLLFREFFPGYQDCSYFFDGRGFFTPTPYGDIVDVLLSNVDSGILDRYRIVIIAGEMTLTGSRLDMLRKYAENGGTVIWSLPQIEEGAHECSGVRSVAEELTSVKSVSRTEGEAVVFDEGPFSYPSVSLFESGRVLLEDEEGNPLVIENAVGTGKVITIVPAFGMTHRLEEKHPLIGGDPKRDVATMYFYEKHLGSRHLLIEGVRRVLFEIIGASGLVDVVASIDPFDDEAEIERRTHVQFITNVLKDPDKLIITVINNDPRVVYTRIRIKNALVIDARDLLQESRSLAVKGEGMSMTLSPAESVQANMAIIEVHLDRPVVRFQESKQ